MFIKILFEQFILFSPQAVRSRGGVVSKEVTLAVAGTQTEPFQQEELGHIDLRSSYWTQSLFRQIGFRRRAGTTGKIEVTDAVKEEVSLSFTKYVFLE